MSDTDLHIDRLINAPRAKVWDAWMTPEHLKEWWMPKPWRTELIGFDPRPGGTFHIKMLGPEGEEIDTPGLFLECQPMERIVFTSALVEGWRPGAPWMAITAAFTLSDEGEGTRYHVHVMHKDEEDARRHEEIGFFDGWGTVVTQLEAFAQGL